MRLLAALVSLLLLSSLATGAGARLPVQRVQRGAT